MPEREPLSGADNAWRRMGTTTNLMSITGVLTFEEAVTYERLCDRLKERLLRFDRFKQHVGGRKRRLLRPYWEPVDGFDIHNHVYALSLPEPADQAAFERFVGKLMSRPLDERRPLWELYLVDNAGPEGGNVAVVRINHSVGDGFALLYVLLGLVDNPEELEFPIGGISAPPAPEGDQAAGSGSSTTGVAGEREMGDRTNEADPEDVEDSHTSGHESDNRISGHESDNRPSGRGGVPGSDILGTVGTAARALKTGYDLLTRPDEPDTSLYGELGPTKRAAWSRRIDLSRVKKLGATHDVTVNDVLLATIAGAVRRVLEDRGEDTADLELSWTVPVNLKAMDARTEAMGNYFGLTFVPVPVGTRAFDERIDIVHERMDARKAGIEAFLLYKLLSIGGHVPESVQRRIMGVFERTATGIVTNVPGPTGTAKLAGSEIGDMIFWVPQANDQGLGISIMSYDGGVRIGVAADANLLPEPRVLTDAFETEFDTQVEQLDP